MNSRSDPDKAALEKAFDMPEPPQLAEAVADALHAKARLPLGSMVVLGLLAGAYISFGGLFALVALAGAEDALPHGVAQVLAGAVFVLGLVLVVIAGAELFTGNSLMAVPLAQRRIGAGALLRSWTVVYAANLAASLAVALLAVAAEAHTAGDDAVGRAALSLAAQKAAMPFLPALCSGILANALVCLAVWMSYGARSATDKVLAVLLPIAAFVAAGLEHSVANMFLIPFGLFVHLFSSVTLPPDASAYIDLAALTPWGVAANLVPVTIGNVIGGALVGLAYWLVYLRDAKPA